MNAAPRVDPDLDQLLFGEQPSPMPVDAPPPDDTKPDDQPEDKQ